MRIWLAWLFATLFFSYQYILRVMPGYMVDEIMLQFDITPLIFGQFAGLYYITYTAAHIPVGIALDKIGPRIVIASCAVLSAIGSIPLIYSDSWIALSVGRALIGLASSAGVLGVFKVLRTYFPENKFALLFGISITIGYMGAVYSGSGLGLLFNLIGIKNAVLFIVILGLLLSLLIFIVIPKNSKNSDKITVLDEIKILLKHRKWLYLSLIGGLMVGPLEGFADAWGIKFLSVFYEGSISYTSATSLISAIFLGLALGSPILGYFMQRMSMKHYNNLIAFFGVSMLALFTSIMMFKFNFYTLYAMLLIIGVCSNYQTITILQSTRFAPKEASGLIGAASNMTIMIFGYFFHSIIGNIMNVEDVSVAIFIKGLSIIPICLMIAIIGMLIFIRIDRKSSINN